MLIKIKSPICKCADDKNIFISRLYELSSFESIAIENDYLYLSIHKNPKQSPLSELQTICDMWGTNYTIES